MENKGKILLVEDDHFLRELYSKTLTAEGYTTMETADGYNGLEMMKSEKPDLVLLDIMIPVLSGIDFLKQAKADATIANIPIVTLTSMDDEAMIKEAFDLGAKGYLIKSQMTPKQLVEEVKVFLA